MFPNCRDVFGRKNKKTKVQQTNKEKPREKKMKNGNNSTYQEPLSEE